MAAVEWKNAMVAFLAKKDSNPDLDNVARFSR